MRCIDLDRENQQQMKTNFAPNTRIIAAQIVIRISRDLFSLTNLKLL